MTTDEFHEAVERLRQVNDAIKDLDDAIKTQAFEVLRPFITKGKGSAASAPAAHPEPAEASHADGGDGEAGLREFLAAQDGSKPSDNVRAIVAWLYGQYGIQPFKASEVEVLAHQVGVTVPTSVNMTLTQMSRDGKKLLQKKAQPSVLACTARNTSSKRTTYRRGPRSGQRHNLYGRLRATGRR